MPLKDELHQEKHNITTMSQSERFLDLYNRLDKFLREESNEGREVSFAHIVKSSKSPVVKRYQSELISFGELRNAIVHNPKVQGRAIAEPHEEVVKQFEKICDSVFEPPKVMPNFQFDVFAAAKDDSIAPVLQEMKTQQFSQVPVVDTDGSVIEIVTNNTISRWLSSQFDGQGGVLSEDVHVGDLIDHVEFPNNYLFLPRTADVYTAADRFLNHIRTHKRNLDCIFITHNGKKNEALLGLITIEDIAPYIFDK